MILSDMEIDDLAQCGELISKNYVFEQTTLRKLSENHSFSEKGLKKKKGTPDLISYGLSSSGYDLRLSANDVKIFGHNGTGAIDPKNFNKKSLYTPEIIDDGNGKYVLVPPKTYALGVSMEEFNMPRDVLGVCLGKSTLARCGMFVNTTPLEPGWKGHLTIEIYNANNAPLMLYLEEGVCQCLFFRTGKVECSYSDRGGKYQEQPEKVVLARMKEHEMYPEVDPETMIFHDEID